MILLSLQTFAEAQIKGKVVDMQAEPIIGANIILVGQNEGTVTDFDGLFVIEKDIPIEVTVSYVGLQDTTLYISPDRFNEIRMKEGLNVIACPVFIEAKYSAVYGYSEIDKIAPEKIELLNPANVYNPTPGLFMHSGALNTNRLTIRGIGSRSPFSTTKIKAYLNDIPLTSGIGESNLEDINLSIVDEIKVYKGPTMPRFGAGLGGVVHYRTYGHERFNNSVSNATSYGSFNTVHNNINYNYSKDGIIFSLNNDFLRSDGYRDNNNYQRQSISGFAQANFDKDVLTVFVNHSLIDAQIPSGLNIEDFNATPNIAAANWQAAEGFEDYTRTQVAITHQRIFENNWTTSVTGFLNNFQNYERRPFNVLTQNAKSIGARVQINKDLYRINGKLKFGTEIFSENEEWSTYETLDEGQGNILSDNFEKRNYSNLFVEYQHNWNRINADIGLNLNTTNYDFDDRFVADGIDQTGQYSFDPILSPFVSINYRKLAKLFHLTFSHGFSAPTLEETLTPNGLVNLEIKPETGWNLELGYKEQIKDFSVELSLYNMWVQNLLVAERVTEDQFIGINAGKTMHPGIESVIAYRKNKRKWNFGAEASYQYQPHHFTEFVNREIDFAGKRLPGNPDHKLHTRIDYNYGKAHINLSNMFVSKMYADDSNTIEVNSYMLTNLGLAYDLYKNNHWLIYSNFQLNNLLDVDYASMIAVNPRSFGSSLPRYLYAGLPRNFKITLQLKYTFN